MAKHLLRTENASISLTENKLISTQFDDIYYSTTDAIAESRYVFIETNQLSSRWQDCQTPHFIIAETGFGSGLNFLLCQDLFHTFLKNNPEHPLKRLFFISFEKYPLTKKDLAQIHQNYPDFFLSSTQLRAQWPIELQGCHRLHFDAVTLDLWFGDINDWLPQLGDYMLGKIDAWFLDGFTPKKNPEMWSTALFTAMFNYSKHNATFATFTASSVVRKGLENAGFHVFKQTGFGKKREMLYGIKATNKTTSIKAPWLYPQAGQSIKEVAIIGGGVASLFLAISCLQRNLKVTIYCEDDAPAQGASCNPQGAIYPQLSDDDLRNSRFYAHAFNYAGHALTRLAIQGVEFQYGWDGVVLCAYNQASQQKIDKITAQQWPESLFQACDEDRQLAVISGIDLPYKGAFIPKAGWISPQELVVNGFNYLEKCGVTIYFNQEINFLSQQQQQWTLYTRQGQCLLHQAVILANGHKLNQFEQTQHLPIYPVRGQVSQIPSGDHLKNLRTVLCFDGYLTPMNPLTETHCLGASHVRNETHREFSKHEQKENKDRLTNNLQQSNWISEIDVSDNQATMGVRCSTRERLPIMGNIPHFENTATTYHNLFNLRRRKQSIANAPYYENLYLLGALGSRGLTSAPLLAEALISLICNEPLPLSEDLIQALNPNRTWIRRLLKGAPIK